MKKEEIAADKDQLDDVQFGTVYRRLLRSAETDFLAFLHVTEPQNDESSYVIGDLHEFLARQIQAVYDGHAPPNQSTSVPPQHGKSQLLAVRCTAWLMGRQPGISVALTGFSGTLLKGFLREIKRIMESPAYRRIFPRIEPVFGLDTAMEVEFSNGSSIICKSAGSKLTGRRVDWLVIDDAHAGRAEAESPLQRRRVIEWFFGDCITRLSEGAKIMLIGTRWHPNDLIGYLTGEEYVEQLSAQGQIKKKFNAITIRAVSNGFNDPLGRAEGLPLFPEQRSLDFLMGQKAQLPGYEWASQYDGDPSTASTGQIDFSKIRYCLPDEIPEALTLTRGWDLAITEKQTADFTAGALCGWDGHTFYVLDIIRRQWSWAKMRNLIIQLAHVDLANMGVSRIAIEGVSGFDAVYSDVRQELLGEVKVTKRNPAKGGKLLRAQPWFNLIEGSRFVLVRGKWNKDFLTELAAFPDPAVHDDQVDSVSISYAELTVKPKKLLVA